MSKNAKAIAKMLLELGCVQLRPHEPFTYASGLKGPIYCDNRRILSSVKERSFIRDAFIDMIKTNQMSYDLIAGMATAGIAYAALVADKLGQPMIYIRSKPKGHGRQNQVEGAYKEGQKILLIEDLVNQAKSLMDGINGARSAGLVVEECFSIVDYQMGNAAKSIKDNDVGLHSLTTFDDIVAAGVDLGHLSDESVKLLYKWRENPENWNELTD